MHGEWVIYLGDNDMVEWPICASFRMQSNHFFRKWEKFCASTSWTQGHFDIKLLFLICVIILTITDDEVKILVIHEFLTYLLCVSPSGEPHTRTFVICVIR